MKSKKVNLSSISEAVAAPKRSTPYISEMPGGPYISFGRKDLLSKKAGKVYSNWTKFYAQACISDIPIAYLEEGSIISLEEMGKCAGSGKVVIKCVHY